MAVEKRRFPRIPVNWPVMVLTSKSSITAETKNISIDGAFIDCLADLREEESFRIAIKAPTRERSLLVTAEVAWANLNEGSDDLTTRGLGVRFTGVIGESHWALSKVISDHLKAE